MSCDNCNSTGRIVYTKDAPSPPYKKGVKLSYGVKCNICNEGSQQNEFAGEKQGN